MKYKILYLQCPKPEQIIYILKSDNTEEIAMFSHFFKSFPIIKLRNKKIHTQHVKYWREATKEEEQIWKS